MVCRPACNSIHGGRDDRSGRGRDQAAFAELVGGAGHRGRGGDGRAGDRSASGRARRVRRDRGARGRCSSQVRRSAANFVRAPTNSMCLRAVGASPAMTMVDGLLGAVGAVVIGAVARSHRCRRAVTLVATRTGTRCISTSRHRVRLDGTRRRLRHAGPRLVRDRGRARLPAGPPPRRPTRRVDHAASIATRDAGRGFGPRRVGGRRNPARARPRPRPTIGTGPLSDARRGPGHRRGRRHRRVRFESQHARLASGVVRLELELRNVGELRRSRRHPPPAGRDNCSTATPTLPRGLGCPSTTSASTAKTSPCSAPPPMPPSHRRCCPAMRFDGTQPSRARARPRSRSSTNASVTSSPSTTASQTRRGSSSSGPRPCRPSAPARPSTSRSGSVP